MQRLKMKRARINAGMSALEVGEAAGIDEMRVFALERGRGRLRDGEAEALARVLGITVTEIVGGER